jgi:hypothetical protein
MSFIYYGVHVFAAWLYIQGKPGLSGFKKRKYNPLCDADEESIGDMLNEELDIDSDEMDLEIEGETASEELSNEI